MATDITFAFASVQEALRPKHSGKTQNAHIVRQRKEPKLDFEQMKRAIEGTELKPSDEEKEHSN